MPVRSLRSPVLKWPDAHTVDQSVRNWAKEAAGQRKDVCRIGYFGSYARGDWGVGSDLDLVIILDQSEVPFEKRQLAWDTLALPVPNDLLVYTQAEWLTMAERNQFFFRTLNKEVVWVYGVE